MIFMVILFTVVCVTCSKYEALVYYLSFVAICYGLLQIIVPIMETSLWCGLMENFSLRQFSIGLCVGKRLRLNMVPSKRKGM